MKKSSALVAVFFIYVSTFGQKLPATAIKWAPTGLVYGNISLQGEYNFGKNSLTAKLGLPVTAHRSYKYDEKDVEFSMKAMSFLAGYRTYLSRKHMKGLYFEPYFKYVHHTSEGVGNGLLGGEPVRMSFTNDYNGVGLGAQLGVQFLVLNRIVIDLFFLGPEINSSRNDFRGVEISNTIPWSDVQASEAERDIRDFLDQFPFIRNRTTVMVDRTNKLVNANFKGVLPGFRAGVSVGIAF